MIKNQKSKAKNVFFTFVVKTLFKFKNILKVLKTIALHRMGKEEEAIALCEEVIAIEPTDENSLQGLSLYFKEIKKSE